MSWTYPGGFDAATALTYANFCQQAYFQYYIYSQTPAQFEFPPYSSVISIPPTGYTLLYDIYYNEGSNSSPIWTYFGYVAQQTPSSNATTQELVFALRGTETVTEWMMDLLFSSTGASGINNLQGNVHQGFAAIYQGLTYCTTGQTPNSTNEVTLTDILMPASPAPEVTSIIVTGHSLGAALAILLTVDVALNYSSTSSTATNLTSVTCYSFASPMVGDQTFANSFNSLIGATSGAQIAAHYRVANGLDKVPYLPPNVFYLPSIGVDGFNIDSPGEYDYMQVNDFCPIDSGILTVITDPHSLTSYATGLNYIITPPTTTDSLPASAKGLSGIAASVKSKRTGRRVRAATLNLRE